MGWNTRIPLRSRQSMRAITCFSLADVLDGLVESGVDRRGQLPPREQPSVVENGTFELLVPSDTSTQPGGKVEVCNIRSVEYTSRLPSVWLRVQSWSYD